MRPSHSLLFFPVLVLALMEMMTIPFLPVAAGEPGAASTPGSVVLNSGSFWRYHVTLKKPASPEAAGKLILTQVPYRAYPGLEQIETPPPPTGWTSSSFDDLEWPRSRAVAASGGSIRQTTQAPGVQFSTGLLCLRGKFSLANPAAAGSISVSIQYRGGIVVHLNGREVARQHLPAGKLNPLAPAEPYPPDAYLDSNGKLIPDDYNANKRIKAGETDLTARIASRDRRLGPIALPADALRAGVNVLAIEVHRADYPPAALQNDFSTRCGWVPCGLLDVNLSVAGATANTARPKGFQAWNQDVNDRLSVLDHGDPNEKLGAVRIIGTRNGTFSGQLAFGSTEAINGLKATITDLKPNSGKAIPASSMQLRWGRLDGQARGVPDWIDGLQPDPPATIPVHKAGGGAVGCLWITVRVPADATPGAYSGVLTLSSDAGSVSTPVDLTVAGWKLPDPQKFRTYVGIYQSPTSLALQYGVKEWSEEHWKLMEKSFALLAQVGNKIVNIPVVNRTQFGNDEGMLYWIRKDDGTYEYDFSVFDRYMEMVNRQLGPQDFVGIQLWHSGGWEARKADQENTFTVVDRKSGTRQMVQVPVFGTEESKTFWKPVLDAIRQRLARLNMEKAMCLGILSDGTAPDSVFKAFDEIVPGGAGWMRGCHTATRAPAPYTLVKGGAGRVVCHEFCYGMSLADPARGLPEIWKQRPWPGVAYIRHNFDDTLSLLKYRTFAERSLYCGTRGLGRTGLDYWDCVKDAKGRTSRVFNRWPFSSCSQREPNLWRLSWPGPAGAEPTVRFQQLLEGLQAAEAMIVVAEAQGSQADRIGPERTEKARQLFLDRLNYSRQHCPEAYSQISFSTIHQGWKDLDARLYSLAAEVSPDVK